MEPIVIIIAVVLLVAVVAGFVVARRPARGELLEPPPVDLGTVTPPDRVGTDERADDELVEPEVEVVDPLTGVLPPAVVITGPELTPEEEAANIAAAEAAELESEQELAAAAEAATRPSFRDRLSKARSAFSGYVGSILSRTDIDAETWDELEEALIRADVGIGPATELLDAVRATVKERGITTSVDLIDAVKAEMKQRLAGPVELHTGTPRRRSGCSWG